MNWSVCVLYGVYSPCMIVTASQVMAKAGHLTNNEGTPIHECLEKVNAVRL